MFGYQTWPALSLNTIDCCCSDLLNQEKLHMQFRQTHVSFKCSAKSVVAQ